MKVFKFGGASVKNSDSIRNILNIISSYNVNDLIVVVSAIDKTTNALEQVVEMYLKNNQEYLQKVDEIFTFLISLDKLTISVVETVCIIVVIIPVSYP